MKIAFLENEFGPEEMKGVALKRVDMVDGEIVTPYLDWFPSARRFWSGATCSFNQKSKRNFGSYTIYPDREQAIKAYIRFDTAPALCMHLWESLVNDIMNGHSLNARQVMTFNDFFMPALALTGNAEVRAMIKIVSAYQE